MSEDGFLKGKHTTVRGIPLAEIVGPARRERKPKTRFCENDLCRVRLRQSNKGRFCSLCEQSHAEMKSAKAGGHGEVAQVARKRNETGRKVAYSFFH
jgi:hypothetical protein